MPVLIPSRASIETVNAVPYGVSLRSVIWRRPKLVAALAGQAEADEPAPLLRHERDRLGRRELRCDRQIALVLAVGRVDDHDELARANVLDRRLDRGERGSRRRSSPHGKPLDIFRQDVDLEIDRDARAAASPSVVAASVCGTSATAKPASSSAATVSETPSTVIEPFSTQ